MPAPVDRQPVCKTWPTREDLIAATFRGSPAPGGQPRYFWHVTDASGVVKDYARHGWRHHHSAEKEARRLWPEAS